MGVSIRIENPPSIGGWGFPETDIKAACVAEIIWRENRAYLLASTQSGWDRGNQCPIGNYAAIFTNDHLEICVGRLSKGAETMTDVVRIPETNDGNSNMHDQYPSF